MVEQLIADICQYHGYTAFLAEKLFELFGVDEVSLLLPNSGHLSRRPESSRDVRVL